MACCVFRGERINEKFEIGVATLAFLIEIGMKSEQLGVPYADALMKNVV